MKRILAVVLVLALLLVLPAYQMFVKKMTLREIFGREMPMDELYKKNVNSVLSTVTDAFFDIVRTGFIISKDGYILTTYSEADEGCDNLSVEMYDGTTHSAKYIDGDKNYGVEVLKIDAEGLTPVRIGNSDEVNVGDSAAVIKGDFQISNGIISGESSDTTVPMWCYLSHFEGRSAPWAAPIFNQYGEVVAMIMDGYTAAPINQLKDFLKDYIK